MGIRQPSRTATFFKQAQAGAEAQKEARETLKKPQALGGAAAVGTAMVANTTGAQQQATQEVKTAGADTTAKVGTAIAGIAPTATSTVYSGTTTPSTPVAALPGDTATVADVDAAQTNINNEIKNTTDAINALNAQIATANAADAKLLQEKKAELEKILQDAQDKLTKENLGQIAGPSTFETEMAQREKLLAEEGGNVGKLATIFGPRWNAKKYGGLSSQIYGKDLEAIQEEASAGLEEKARAEGRADVAEKEYKEGIASGKLKVAEKLKSEQAKLDFLKKTPEELSAYSRDELKKIFGFEDVKGTDNVVTNQIDKLFNFDATTGKSTGSKLTATQLALTNRNKALADDLTKIPELRNKAAAATTKKLEETYFPKNEYNQNLPNVIEKARQEIIKLPKSTSKRTGSWYNRSEERINFGEQQKELDTDFNNKMAIIENDLRNAVKNANAAEAKRLSDSIVTLVATNNAKVNEIREKYRAQGFD